MIKYTSGNILRARTEAIVNTVNCVGIMGKGLAFQFKEAYPRMFEDYVKACKLNVTQEIIASSATLILA
jgi:O-acetyl-ADP-ribose deacetylase (regulator of RNase III)